MSQTVDERVKQIVAKHLKKEVSAIQGRAKFIEDLGADSLDIVELLMMMEEQFGIDIPEEEADMIRTVDDAVAFIKKNENV
jgi:acyl carrier protein